MEQENANILGGQLSKKNLIEFICIMILTAIVWNLPTDIFGIDGPVSYTHLDVYKRQEYKLCHTYIVEVNRAIV